MALPLAESSPSEETECISTVAVAVDEASTGCGATVGRAGKSANAEGEGDGEALGDEEEDIGVVVDDWDVDGRGERVVAVVGDGPSDFKPADANTIGGGRLVASEVS